ncbi:MAG: hypothetical protein CL681_04210 [Blastopirellula sp.]|nr:hypothetical protein [Blastopirellula sp.]
MQQVSRSDLCLVSAVVCWRAQVLQPVKAVEPSDGSVDGYASGSQPWKGKCPTPLLGHKLVARGDTLPGWFCWFFKLALMSFRFFSAKIASVEFDDFC